MSINNTSTDNRTSYTIELSVVLLAEDKDHARKIAADISDFIVTEYSRTVRTVVPRTTEATF